jgi:hypothetical protein
MAMAIAKEAIRGMRTSFGRIVGVEQGIVPAPVQGHNLPDAAIWIVGRIAAMRHSVTAGSQ